MVIIVLAERRIGFSDSSSLDATDTLASAAWGTDVNTNSHSLSQFIGCDGEIPIHEKEESRREFSSY
jgi:hypothetical protein